MCLLPIPKGSGYGLDLDLTGVALGSNSSGLGSAPAQGQWRLGALFNVGSGTVDGTGAGAAIDNDFEYWDLGAYMAYQAGSLTLVGDLSYTAVDNDLSGMTNLGSVSATSDSTSLSLGVTSKLDFELNDLTLSPHVGLRYNHIEVDDYDVTGKGGQQYFSFTARSIDVISIPLGVMLSTEITSAEWTVQPALDLTVTPIFGDHDLKGDVRWSGIADRVYPTVTEVLDELTYSASLGLEASSISGISLGLGLNYTGSSHTDEFIVQAHASLIF